MMMRDTSPYEFQGFRDVLTTWHAETAAPATEAARKQEAISWQVIEHQENLGAADANRLSKEYRGPRRRVSPVDVQIAQDVQLAVRLKPRPVQSRKTEFAVLGVAALSALAWVFSSVDFVDRARDAEVQRATATTSQSRSTPQQAGLPATGSKVPETALSKPGETASGPPDSTCLPAQWAMGFCPERRSIR